MSQLMDVLEFQDNSGRIMVRRFPQNGTCEIKWGAQLTVRESQAAVFFRDGRSLDVFGPGRYVLETLNVPKIAKWVTSFAYGPTSPFRAEVYFINLKLFPNLKWGTREPILFKDSQLQMIRLRSHGIFSIQIANPYLFVNKIVGTRDLYEDADIEDYLRSMIISRLTDVLGNQFTTVFEIPQAFNQLALLIKSALQLDFEGCGIYLHDLYINTISLPPEVKSLIDARTGMSAVGNMDDFIKFKAAIALEGAASSPQGSASTGVGVGAGMGMGYILPQLLHQSLTPRHNDSNVPIETPMDKIRRLKELLDLNAITNDEFEAKKAKLLGEI